MFHLNYCTDFISFFLFFILWYAYIFLAIFLLFSCNTPIIHFSIGAIVNTCSFHHVRFVALLSLMYINEFIILLPLTKIQSWFYFIFPLFYIVICLHIFSHFPVVFFSFVHCMFLDILGSANWRMMYALPKTGQHC
jgi:hypothetical protein